MSLYDTNFTGWDWGIVGVYLAASIVIGLWANRYVGNLSNYLLAGRTLRIRLALATMTGTELGLVTVMYSAELGYLQQYASLYLALYEAAFLLIIGLSGFVVYRLRQTAVLTIPEYYERRYSRGVRVVGGSMMVVSGVLNMGLFLKAGAQFLTAISGLQDPLYLKLIMTGLLLLVLFYTVLGGMVSVVITDLVQFVVLGIGMLVVTWFVVSHIGFDGLQDVVTVHDGYVDPTSAVNPTNPNVPAAGIGGGKMVQMAVVLFTALMLWPAGASRTLAVKSSEVAQQLYLYSTIPFLARRALPVLWGIGAFAFFRMNPELLNAFQNEVAASANGGGTGVSSLSATPLFLAKIIPTGILGLVTAGMVAAFMSTHDSYLLCWSGVVTQDIVAPLFGPLSQRQRILSTRISIVVIGAMLLVWGLWYETKANLWEYMATTGTVYLAGVLPVVVGGLYWKRSATAGAYVALLGGVTGVLAMGPAVNWMNLKLKSVQVSFHIENWHMVLATFAISSLGFVVVSLLFPQQTKPSSHQPKGTT
jgi:SSS family solute:Na+ symporter